MTIKPAQMKLDAKDIAEAVAEWIKKRHPEYRVGAIYSSGILGIDTEGFAAMTAWVEVFPVALDTPSGEQADA